MSECKLTENIFRLSVSNIWDVAKLEWGNLIIFYRIPIDEKYRA